MIKPVRALIIAALAGPLVLSGCENGLAPNTTASLPKSNELDTLGAPIDAEGQGLFDLFSPSDNPNTTVGVSKYIWTATLDVLGFLPVTNADPFTGVIVTGFGTPPGGGRAYRAVVYITDPALDARSLNLSLYTRNAAVDPATVRAVEDAILTRARQLRSAESRL
ncbi:DUF3576 domain-containing protein [Aliiroseovarius sp. PTFE2010]|uniref:DUF3576 domain-containing protein n=1 Tax=Aliiroseovarius sp. PTFE2010 TaxID=3417190 RepID=UPI003CE9E5FD